MLKISIRVQHRDLEPRRRPEASLTLPFDRRQKARQKATLDDGRAVAIQLERGGVLRAGDCLQADDGTVIVVKAAAEELSLVSSAEPLELCRAAYHLGNRHVPVQVEPDRLYYPKDHVLDEMVVQLGLTVTHALQPFEPESGAYSHGHAHHDDHHHHHDSGDDHGHAH